MLSKLNHTLCSSQSLVIFSTNTDISIVFLFSLVYNNTKNAQFQAYFVFL